MSATGSEGNTSYLRDPHLHTQLLKLSITIFAS